MYPTVIRLIIWITAIFYLLQNLYFPITHEVFGLAYIFHPNFNLIQLFTHGFLHGDAMHIFVNMLLLVIFGSKIENELGFKNFLFLYFASIMFGGLFQQVSQMIEVHKLFGTYTPLIPTDNLYERVRISLEYGPRSLELFDKITIGASGGVFGLLAAYVTLFPNHRMKIPFFDTSISSTLLITIFIIGEIYMFLFNPQQNVAHIAHIGGLFIGWLIASKWKLSNLKNSS